MFHDPHQMVVIDGHTIATEMGVQIDQDATTLCAMSSQMLYA
jgi:hypothetical protein